MNFSPYAEFRRAIERRDVDGAADLFAADAVFNSPIVHTPYQGRELVRLVIGGVAQVFEDFRYIDDFTHARDPDTSHVLRFSCRIGDRELEGVDILRGNRHELTELTVLVRPLSAATALRDRMAALMTGTGPAGTT